MSRRYLAAAVLIAMVVIGVISLRWHEERSPPVAGGIYEDIQVPVSYVLSSAAPLVESSVAEPLTTKNVCPQKMTQEELEEHASGLQQHFKEVARALSRSDNAENVLAAALLLQLDQDASLEALDRAFRLAPRSPLVTWNMLRVCRDNEDADCDLDVVETNAIRADGYNGAVWMEIAMLRLAEGRSDEARLLVRKAVAAPRFDSYFIDHAQSIERALEAGGNSTYAERMVAGIGHSAALVVSYYEIVEHCRTVDAADAVWIDLCYQLGEKMLADGRILLDQAIGSSLVKIATSHSDDAERIEAAAKRESEFRNMFKKLDAPAGTQHLLTNDEAVLRRYVENLATFGEIQAMRELAVEAALLRETSGYDQCNFANPVTGL